MQIFKQYKIRITKKTIYRYMKINGIKSIIRKKKKKYGSLQHHTIPNLIKRNFNAEKPNNKWAIDISYLHTTEGVEYLCAIKDMYDKSIVSYLTSHRMNNSLVLNTVTNAINTIKHDARKDLILHSDQGAQFTSDEYVKKLKENSIKHSVSAKGNCVDNSPIESWFSALKTECIYLINKVPRNKVRELVSNYVYYYNNQRLQEKLKELTPIEFRSLALN